MTRINANEESYLNYYSRTFRNLFKVSVVVEIIIQVWSSTPSNRVHSMIKKEDVFVLFDDKKIISCIFDDSVIGA
jgi:hypothetical protein